MKTFNFFKKWKKFRVSPSWVFCYSRIQEDWFVGCKIELATFMMENYF